MLDSALNILKAAHGFVFNPFQSRTLHESIRTHLDKLLPQNAHHLCNRKLGLSLTNMRTYENNFVKDFNSRRDLIDALSAGCFIPLWSGHLYSPLYKGEKHADGAYSDNMPKFELTPDERLSVLEGNFNCIKQVCVTPFPSDVDVSPQNERGPFMVIFGTKYKLNWSTVVKSIQAMFPFPSRSYEPFLYAGHRDMKDYILRSNLIKCQKCYRNLVSEDKKKTVISNNYNENDCEMKKSVDNNSLCCLLCLKILEQVDSLEIPQELSRLNRG